MIYSDWTTALAGFLPETLVNAASGQPFPPTSRYNQVLTRAIEYAELRIYRELDFLAAREALSSSCTAGSRYVSKPNRIIVVEEANVILPAGANADDAGSTRQPLQPVSTAFINRCWPSVALQQTPEHFAQIDDQTFLMGPTPDLAYNIEFYGTFRPNPLSPTNTTTFLTQWLPDLFLAASMLFFSGYQKTFGAISGDPQQGLTWEQYYGELASAAKSEEMRKKLKGAVPAPAAVPPPPA